jgi:cancer susceptibility candidate protein 1
LTHSQSEKENTAETDPESGTKEIKEPEIILIAVTLKLPADVLFCEEPQIVRWDPKDNNWMTSGFSNKNYNEGERLLSFSISDFGTLALVQDAYVNMPFQSWELRAREVGHAQLSITAAISQVEIQILEDKVCLSQPADKPELEHLINVWMSINDLVKKMRYSGLNVFPDVDSNRFVKVLDKNATAEDRLYRQMADVASVMSFKFSRWNYDVNDNKKLIIQGAQTLQDEPLVEENLSLFLFTKARAEKLKMTEYSDEYSDERATGTDYHTNLYHLSVDVLGFQGKQRLQATSPVFKENIYQILHRTRLLTHS